MFLPVDLHDLIVFEESSVLTVCCNPAVTASIDENIVVKAAKAYATAFPHDVSTAKITVNKAIPTGGGLGGGSSDAASTLLGLALLNGKTIDQTSRSELQPIAETLGSDVPFFLDYSVAHVTGRGELIERVAGQAPWSILLICPGIHVNTAHAYSTLGITCEQRHSNVVNAWHNAIVNNAFDTEALSNSFEGPVFAQHPVLATCKQMLYEQGALFASMSGSGSTIYGLFTDVDKAVDAQKSFVNMQSYICASVSEEYRYV